MFAGFHFVKIHQAIGTTTGQKFPVSTQGDSFDRRSLLLQRMPDLSGLGIPNDHFAGLHLAAAATTPGDQILAIGRVGNAKDLLCLAAKGSLEFSGIGIPNADGAVRAGTGDLIRFRIGGQTENRSRVSFANTRPGHAVRHMKADVVPLSEGNAVSTEEQGYPKASRSQGYRLDLGASQAIQVIPFEAA